MFNISLTKARNDARPPDTAELRLKGAGEVRVGKKE